MNEEQRQTAILNRLKEMGVKVDKPIYTLLWEDVARVMVETDGFEKVAELPTDKLVHILNTIQDGLESLEWYDNIQASLRLADQTLLLENPANTEHGHLESDFEGRVSGTDV
jgi:hypothetical protein